MKSATGESQNKSQITREIFANAKSGDEIEDKYGRKWNVIQNLGDDPPTLFVQCPGHRAEEVYFYDDLGIVDEEMATIIELSDPKTRLIPNGSEEQSHGDQTATG
jgi:hypothetical protein